MNNPRRSHPNFDGPENVPVPSLPVDIPGYLMLIYKFCNLNTYAPIPSLDSRANKKTAITQMEFISVLLQNPGALIFSNPI